MKRIDAPLAFGFRLATQRQPADHELRLLQQARRQYYDEYAEDPQAAKELLSVGQSPPAADVDPQELAAYTALANVLLNLDEVMSKE